MVSSSSAAPLPGPGPSSAPSRTLQLRQAGGILLAVVALWLLARQVGGLLPAFAEWIDGLGFWGPALFMLTYAVSVVALVPASILTLAAGAIFGLAWGTLYAFVAATLGALAAFVVARHFARGLVERRLAGTPRFAAIDRAVGDQGLRIVALLRLSPVFPFTLLNYVLGLTRVSFRDYALASPGMLPGTLLYVYYGKLIGDVTALASGVSVERDAAYWIVMGLGLVATVVVTALVTRVARRALQEEVPDASTA